LNERGIPLPWKADLENKNKLGLGGISKLSVSQD
jgi:hypothetical protein